MKSFRILFLVLTASLALGTGVALACDGAADAETAEASKTEAPAEVQLVTLRVEEATCGGCVVPIRKELTQLAGVVSVESSEADYKDVLVKVEPGKVSDAQLIEAVKKAGYKAVVKEGETKTS